MKLFKYIFAFLFIIGCQERDFDNPYDPFIELNIKPVISYSGTELNQLKIINSGIDSKSFKRYEVYFSRSAGFTPSNDNLFRIVTKFDSTGIFLGNLEENVTYYARVKYVDVLERTELSDIISILTGNAQPSKPVFSDYSEVQMNKISIRWKSASIKDFLKYELYFSTLKGFPLTTVNLYRTMTAVKDTSLLIENLKPNTYYYFRVRLFDKGNLYSDSDEKTMKTGNDIPTAVVMEDVFNATDSSLSIRWSRNTDEDFLRYEIHYSTNPNFVVSYSTLIKSFSDQNTTSTTITGLSASSLYYFKVRVVDKEGANIASNEKSGMTAAPSGSDVPQAVTIEQPAEITQTSIRINWSPYTGTDFKQYEVHFSTEQNFVLSPSTIYSVPLQNQTLRTRVVKSLMTNTKYYFRVRIINTKNKFSDSEEVSATTLP